MKIKKLLALALSCSLLCSIPVMAEESDSTEYVVSASDATQYFENAEFDLMEPLHLNAAQVTALAEKDEIQLLSTVPDGYEPNDSYITATPYEDVDILTTQLSTRNDLYRLGMRHANLHSATDVDWYVTEDLKSGDTCFVDIRNVGKSNVYIEVYYIYPDNTATYYTTNPTVYDWYENAPEKYFYFTPEEDGKYYIRVASDGNWNADMMDYFFFVGNAIQEFDIVSFPTGSVQIWGDDYRTYTFDISSGVVPSQTAIVSISLANSFSDGNSCSEIESYMSASSGTYYSDSNGMLKNITGVSLGQRWTIGGRCADGKHFLYWGARLYGSFVCIMEPYPGNELDF